MPRYSYRVRRPQIVAAPQPEPEAEPEPTYRELQAEAKDLGIAANQSADDLKEAIAEHSDGE